MWETLLDVLRVLNIFLEKCTNAQQKVQHKVQQKVLSDYVVFFIMQLVFSKLVESLYQLLHYSIAVNFLFYLFKKSKDKEKPMFQKILLSSTIYLSLHTFVYVNFVMKFCLRAQENKFHFVTYVNVHEDMRSCEVLRSLVFISYHVYSNVDKDKSYMEVECKLFGRTIECFSHQSRIQNPVKYLRWKKLFAKIVSF